METILHCVLCCQPPQWDGVCIGHPECPAFWELKCCKNDHYLLVRGKTKEDTVNRCNKLMENTFAGIMDDEEVFIASIYN